MGEKLLGIKAIGFDVDQTLYQTPKEIEGWIQSELLKVVMARTGLDEEAASRAYRERYEELRSNTKALVSFGADGQQVIQNLFDDMPLDKYLGVDQKLQQMIKRLGDKYSLFIISNGTERQVIKKLRMLGLDPAEFDPLVCCYDHEGWNKPAPTSFLSALEKLGLAPEEVVYVGDRVETDIEPAQGVGMKAILVGKESEVADASCNSVYEIEQLFT